MAISKVKVTKDGYAVQMDLDDDIEIDPDDLGDDN